MWLKDKRIQKLIKEGFLHFMRENDSQIAKTTETPLQSSLSMSDNVQ
jgi:hypothetical protein